MRNLIAAIFVLSLLGACSKEPPIEDYMLDGDILFDPSINDPDRYLVSAQYPSPSANDLEKHIIIAAHGYSASTFEWDEFRDWTTDTNYRISQVLLGAHGRTYADFKASTWEDWLESIQLEYETLLSQGYTKISLVGSSTGGTLLIELIRSHYFQDKIAPENLFLVDPIVLSSIKIQSLAGILGPMLVYSDTESDAEENQYWYRFRPQETIRELNELMSISRRALEDGMHLPSSTRMTVFHSKHDPTANSLSSVLIYRGLKNANGSAIDVQIMDSDIHVFTRLSLRENVTALQRANQISAFNKMASLLGS